jgi:hypothetical protein
MRLSQSWRAEPIGLVRGFFLHLGGDDRSRTGDPLLAKQVLSRLSYIPVGGGPR